MTTTSGPPVINHVYMHSCRSTIEATEKLNSNLVILPGVGAFEQLFGTVRGEFEQKFSRNSNARGVAREDIEASIWLVHKQHYLYGLILPAFML